MSARIPSALTLTLLLACGAKPPAPPEPPPASASPPEPVPVPVAVAESPSAAASAPPPPAPTPSASSVSAPSPAPTAGTGTGPSGAKHAKRPGGPRAYNIGMHIGGGPHDDFTKEPIKKSVAPHHPAMAQCLAKLDAPKPLDFGIDLLVPGDGGKALEVSHARSTVKGDAFVACVVEVFKTISFEKPRNGRTKVSYSLRFEP